LNEKQSLFSLIFLQHVCLVADFFSSSDPKNASTCLDSPAFGIGLAWTTKGPRA